MNCSRFGCQFSRCGAIRLKINFKFGIILQWCGAFKLFVTSNEQVYSPVSITIASFSEYSLYRQPSRWVNWRVDWKRCVNIHLSRLKFSAMKRKRCLRLQIGIEHLLPCMRFFHRVECMKRVIKLSYFPRSLIHSFFFSLSLLLVFVSRVRPTAWMYKYRFGLVCTWALCQSGYNVNTWDEEHIATAVTAIAWQRTTELLPFSRQLKHRRRWRR